MRHQKSATRQQQTSPVDGNGSELKVRKAPQSSTPKRKPKKAEKTAPNQKPKVDGRQKARETNPPPPSPSPRDELVIDTNPETEEEIAHLI